MSAETFQPKMNPAVHFQSEYIPVMVQPEEHPLHDETDKEIIETLDDARSQVVIAQRVIGLHTTMLSEEIAVAIEKTEARAARDAATVVERAAGHIEDATQQHEYRASEIDEKEARARAKAEQERMEAVEERKRKIREIYAAYFEKVGMINTTEAREVDLIEIERIDERNAFETEVAVTTDQRDTYTQMIEKEKEKVIETYEETKNEGINFYNSCLKTSAAMLEGASMYREAHAHLTETIEEAVENLVQANADKLSAEETVQEKTALREELLRDYDACARMTADWRKELFQVTRQSIDRAGTEYSRAQNLDTNNPPQTADEINLAMANLEDSHFEYRQEHAALTMRMASIRQEIDNANVENAARNEQINTLKHEIVAYEAECDRLADLIAMYEQQLNELNAMKQKMAYTAKRLQYRAEALDVILRDGFDALDNIPDELKELVGAAINAGFIQADVEPTFDLASAIPDIDHSTIKVEVDPEHMPITHFAGAANKTVYTGDNAESSEQQAAPTLQEIVSELSKEAEAAIQWVQEHAGKFLPEAARLIPEKLTVSGLSAKVRSRNE